MLLKYNLLSIHISLLRRKNRLRKIHLGDASDVGTVIAIEKFSNRKISFRREI